MTRFYFFALFLALTNRTHAQCVVAKDDKGRVITTCPYSEQALLNNTVNQGAITHTQVRYLGSEYFTFPIWQAASVQLAGRDLPCKLAYNLVTQQVDYQLDQTNVTEPYQPDAFTVDGSHFIRKTMLGSSKYGFYLMVVHEGPTRLLKQLKTQLKLSVFGNGYTKADELQGAYERKEIYYIQRQNAEPQPIGLTSKAVLDVLADQAPALAARLPEGKVTPDEVVNALKAYDQLTTATLHANIGKTGPALNHDPLFSHSLRKIKFPPQALSQHVYGRVYAGFDIDDKGQLQNFVLLSPDNVGFALDFQVKQALKKLPPLRPEYAGQYLLPVAFTYNPSAGYPSALIPINTLPAGRAGNRTVLNELVVPAPASSGTSLTGEGREVWGYYR